MAKKDLSKLAMSLTVSNLVKGRGASGKTTYLDRFVNALLVDGVPTEPKTRMEIISEISLDIAVEQRTAAIEAGEKDAALDLENNEDDQMEFIEIAKKVKPMVAAAISNSNNATALSYNDKYKTIWRVVKDGSKVSLEAIS